MLTQRVHLYFHQCQSRKKPNKKGLTVGSDDRNALSLFDRQVDIVKQFFVAIPVSQVLHRDDRLADLVNLQSTHKCPSQHI